MLAYGLGTLYLTTVSINSQPVYAIPANLAAIGNGLTITYWVMNFEPNVVRDIAVVSKVLQPLPGMLSHVHLCIDAHGHATYMHSCVCAT